MSKDEVEEIKEKLILLKNLNPLKFERFVGRLEVLYEIENEKFKLNKN
ncbi:Uncharacterised protein [[Clostridium] sordellii]|jgi:hypothetical protein|nr:hypothetical protein [Paeniclostridium sordellii]DAU04089.1 MAG TPA: hypothetical protein [Caudoviricetes sp.]CEN23172.1 Uncharacterised protein [[Clostridium] sordellii] [Paeniclostridium sordellii]CEN24187.1 Uncharacterised protein [[Clostridium] sordellii] [Paeniclostridium sordellii]CEN26224.1 Uncharacterised protein [[Clostridium] sordellii] [Paeniclostridium sordellii]CEP50425.1 Uncharacterised protein [[Clostridium] sordellii] [Paeniclostridium sordellii]